MNENPVFTAIHEKLATAPWLVHLSSDQRAMYLHLKNAEIDWLAALEANGATLIPGGGRHVAVAIPPGVLIPPWHDLAVTLDSWGELLRKSAFEQGKEESIGERSASRPVWLGPDGKTDRPIEDPPAYRAARIQFRSYQAYRGTRLAPDEVLDYLTDRIKAAESHVEHSLANHNRKRAQAQAEKLKGLAAALGVVSALVGSGDVLSARVCSGHGFRVHVKGEGIGFSASLANIALIPVTEAVLIQPAPTRQRTSPEDSLLHVGELHLSIKRK